MRIFNFFKTNSEYQVSTLDIKVKDSRYLKVAQIFHNLGLVFAGVSISLLTGGAIGQVVPGIQLALAPFAIAAVVSIAVSAIFFASEQLIKKLAPSSSRELPANDSLLNHKNLPKKINHEDEVKRACLVIDRYQELKVNHPDLQLMAPNYGLNGNFISFSMQGLAVIASDLKQKHHLEHLYVCDSVEAFQDKLLEMSNAEDFKASFVIPARALSWSWSRVQESQHKASVLVEKKEGKLKIVYMDSEPREVNESLLSKEVSALSHLDTEEGSPSFATFWAITHSGIDMNNVELSRFIHKREHANLGCETFALKDAVAFLKTDNFSDKVVRAPTPEGSSISPIIALPADFMKTAQSMSQIQKYMQDYPALANQNLVTRSAAKSPRTLQQAVQQRTAKGYNKNGKLVDQNHYTSAFSLKYHRMLLESMEQMETEELKDKINSTFVFKERPLQNRGETPKTMNDMFNCWKHNFADEQLIYV